MGRPKKTTAESEPGTEPAKKPGPAPKKYVLLKSIGTESAPAWEVAAGGYVSVDEASSQITHEGSYWIVPEQTPGKNYFVASKVETISLS